MKNQNQFVQAMKCCLTNGKFALLLTSSILLFTSCKQSGSQDSESVSDQVSNLISLSPCDKFIGKYSREQTVSSITTKSSIEIKKEQDFYKLFLKANSTTNNPSLKLAASMTNDQFNAIFPSDGYVCTCNDKGNIELNLEGKKAESMIDNSGNLIYGGLTFYKVNKSTEESANTEEATEVAVETYKFEDVTNDNKLPFVGLRYFNFYDGKVFDMSILIKENGNCIIKCIGNMLGEEVYYKGKYKNIIDIGDDTYYKIIGDYICSVDNLGNNVIDEVTNKPLCSELTK